MKNYCLSCMKEAPSGNFCPFCGNRNIADQTKYRLRPGTILHNRYLTGNCIASDDVSITYIGRDLNADKRVTVKEYYPNGLVSRNNTISQAVIADNTRMGVYQDGMQSFLSQAANTDNFSENGTAYIVADYHDNDSPQKTVQTEGQSFNRPVNSAPPQPKHPMGDTSNNGYRQPQKPHSDKSPIIIAIIVILCVLLIAGSVVYFFIQYFNIKNVQSNVPAAQPTISADSESTDAPTEVPKPTEAAPLVDEITASASHTLADQGGHSYSPSNVMTKDGTCWCPKEGSGVGEWIRIDYPEKQKIDGIDIINGYAGTGDQYNNNGKVEAIKIEFSDGRHATAGLNIKAANARKTVQHLSFDPVETTYIKITILSIEKGEQFEDTCITYIEPTNP